MTETQQTIFTAPGLEILPAPIEQAAGVLADFIDGQQFWLIVCDGFGFKTVEAIMNAHYADCGPEDRFACITIYKGWTFGIFVLRRRLMLARQYKYQLSKHDVLMTERELTEAGALIRTADFNRGLAREFARKYLDLAVDDLAMET